MDRLTAPQRRLLEIIKASDGCAEYWPVVNDWVRDSGPTASLAFTNINATVAAMLRKGAITIDDDGLFHATDG